VLNVTADDRVLHKTSIGFDVSLWEILLPPAVGAVQVVLPDGLEKDAFALIHHVTSRSITKLHFVPSLLAASLEMMMQEGPLPVHAVVCSGEALSLAVQQKFLSEFNGIRAFDFYGPTEAAIVTVYSECERDVQLKAIGSTVWNTTASIRSQPGRTRGELMLEGLQLANGYMGRPSLTAARFTVLAGDRFVDVGGLGSRSYHTGDEVKLGIDGNIVYQGRIDFQVKIRGNRIELGEIDKVLEAIGGVAQVATILWPKGGGDGARLVSFVRCGTSGEESAVNEQMLSACRQKLPSYMIPSQFVHVEAFQVSASGKLDRTKLIPPSAPKPVELRVLAPSTAPSQAYVALKAVFEAVLRKALETTSMSFFDAGGDSIAAIKLVSAIRNKYPYATLTVKDVFDFPTIEAMASRLGLDGDVAPDSHGVADTEGHVKELDDVVDDGSSSEASNKLRAAWRDVLKVDSVKDDDSFFDMGGDSISAIRLVSDIRLEFPESSFTVKDAVQYPTLGEMLKHVIRRSGGALVDEVEVSTISTSLTNHSDGHSLQHLNASTSFTKLRRSHSRQTVICFPGLGWLGGEYADFVEVSNGYNVLLANNPRGSEKVEELVARVGDEIATRGDERLILVGHSMGGLVAYRVAEYLGGKASVLIDVIMIDTHLPVTRQDDGGIETVAIVERLLGGKDMVTSATRGRFKRNASLMNTWVMRKELEVTTEEAIVIEAGESSAEGRRVKVAAEMTFNVPGADHFSILKWPHVLNVVAVVRNLLAKDSGD
jgi:acyl carrier protein